MHRLLIVLICITLVSCTQSNASNETPAENTQLETVLSDYEGLYEYEHGSSLIMVHGPKNRLLFASINDARYPLRPARKDVFLNAGDVEVVFVRGDNGEVIGYRENKAAILENNPLFKMLDRTKRLPASIWHAKPESAPDPYAYRAPEDLDDGIDVDSLKAGDPLLDSLSAMTTQVYAETFPGLQSALVYKSGTLVFEEYFYEFNRDVPHQQRSATKTLMALLAGAAIDSGAISSIEEKIMPYFDQYSDLTNVDDRKRAITIGNLLSMQSGFDCNDWGDSIGNESKMVQTDDWARFILDLPMTATPGTTGSYCSGNVVLVGKIIEKATGKPLKEFADDVLFKPLGIKNYEWDFRPDLSNANNFIQAWLRPRDMMKIGILISDDGIWNGEQIISKDWISELTARQSEIGDTPYGYFFWRRYLFKDGKRYEIPQASGNGGQKTILLKKYNAIIVFTGGGYNQQSHTNDLLYEYILAGIAR